MCLNIRGGPLSVVLGETALLGEEALFFLCLRLKGRGLEGSTAFYLNYSSSYLCYSSNNLSYSSFFLYYSYSSFCLARASLTLFMRCARMN